jgi:hypothetical protein
MRLLAKTSEIKKECSVETIDVQDDDRLYS